MSDYTVIVVGAVRRQLRRISQTDKKRILNKIENLGTNPRPHGYK